MKTLTIKINFETVEMTCGEKYISMLCAKSYFENFPFSIYETLGDITDFLGDGKFDKIIVFEEILNCDVTGNWIDGKFHATSFGKFSPKTRKAKISEKHDAIGFFTFTGKKTKETHSLFWFENQNQIQCFHYNNNEIF